MSFPNPVPRCLTALREKGFNPCFSGCPSRTPPIRRFETLCKSVSILVLVDVLPEPARPPPTARVIRVSILVLVDVLPEPFSRLMESFSRGSFNPCFSGCPSRTILAEEKRRDRQGFNPCFSGCPSRTPSYTPFLPSAGSFNPCFSGCPSRTIHVDDVARCSVVSILVLVDVLPELYHGL